MDKNLILIRLAFAIYQIIRNKNGTNDCINPNINHSKCANSRTMRSIVINEAIYEKY
jgi:hypothetical protein